MKPVKFVMINPTSPCWRVAEGERPRQSRFFRFSLLPSLSVAASMPSYVASTIIDEDVQPVDFDIDADLVGITFMTHNAPRAYEIADRFRQRGTPVIVGGYHPTFLPEEATRMTPFPGTPLFDELDEQGRIFDKYWGHYDFNHVVFEPKHMSPEPLDNGVGWVGRMFYSRRNVARRVWKSLGYLSPAVALGGVLPLNLGYRVRKEKDGEFRRGDVYVAHEAGSTHDGR